MNFASAEARRVLKKDVIDALDEVCQKHGLMVEFTGGKFSSGDFMMKLTFSTQGAPPHVLAFKTMHGQYDLKADDLGRTFLFRNRTMRVIGLEPRRKRYPVLCENVLSLKKSLFPVDTVLAALGRPRTLNVGMIDVAELLGHRRN